MELIRALYMGRKEENQQLGHASHSLCTNLALAPGWLWAELICDKIESQIRS